MGNFAGRGIRAVWGFFVSPISTLRSPTIQLPAAADGSRTFIRFTSDGLMLALVTILIGFAAWHSGTNLLYLIFATLVSAYLIHGFLVGINLRKITIRRSAPAHAYAGKPFSVSVFIQNSKRYTRTFALGLQDLSSINPRQVHGYVAMLHPGAGITFTHSVEFSQRGRHSFKGLRVSSRFPFGFEERGIQTDTTQPILILPSVYPVDPVVATMSAELGEQDSSRRGEGSDLHGIRQYNPGEHARHVHWRSSARAGSLMVVEHEREENRRVMLVIDSTCPGDNPLHADQDNFEKAIEVAASLVRHFNALGIETALTTPTAAIPFGKGPAHELNIMKLLATIELGESDGFSLSKTTAPETIQIIYRDSSEQSALPFAKLIDARHLQIIDGRLVRKSTSSAD